MIRALSDTPLLEDMISPDSKFVGEALEQKDVRTVFVSAKEDNEERENRVVLLLGPTSSQKSELIDFLCNYFYGVDSMDQRRFHISNEKFNSETPTKPVQCYIFNETKMSVRPVILDMIACGDTYDGFDSPSLIHKWLLNNWKMRLDVIAIVFSQLHRMSMHEEDELQQVLSNLPEHVRNSIVVFITASDGSRTFEPLLRRFGLSECPKFTINTSCTFQKQMEDRLNDEHRRRYWKMSVNQFDSFMEKVQETTPITISGLPFVDDGIYGVQESGQNSSRSSVYSSSNVRYDYVPYKSDHRSFTQNTQPSPLPPAGVGDRRHSVPDDVRHYADETTPPPVLHDVADRYSTVAYMNHEPTHNSTRVYSHSPTRSQVGVRDAHRLSRDDLRVVDAQSSPADSQSEELRRMYSGRSGNSVKPTGDVTARYVYDTANRNYTAYGERQARESYTSFTNNDRKRWSRSSEPRSETYINDPYYSGKDVVSGYGVIETRRSRTSLHSHGSVPELIHSENKYDYQQLTDQQNREMERKSRLDTERRSRRQSEGSRQIYIDRQISPERQRKDQYSGTYTNVNMQDNPQYSIRREVPPPVIPPKPQVVPHVQRVNGGEVYEDERSIYEAYSQIQHQRPQPPIYGGQTLQPIPPPPQPQPIPQQYPPRYDQVPDQSISNHYIIPKSMRGSSSPILQVQPQPQPQPQQQQQYEAYGEADYVSRNLPLGVTEETTTTTTTTRNEEIERKRRKKKEEEDRKKSEEIYVPYNNGEQDYDRYNNYRDAENALIEEEYNTRHLKRTTEHPHRKQPPQKRDNTKDQHRGGKKSRYIRIKNRTTYYGDECQRWKVVFFIETLAPIIVATFFLILLIIFVYNEVSKKAQENQT